MSVRIIIGDVRERLLDLPDQSVHCVVTSPPYFGLRDYGMAGQIGLEPTPDAFVAELVAVFREVHRVLRDDGTLWLNLGDSYSNAGTRQGDRDGNVSDGTNSQRLVGNGYIARVAGLKNKDLIGIPWRVAFALQADGWYLRQDIIWSKPNPMPESVTDRCTKAHEYLFLLSKSARYHYDQDAILEDTAESTVERLSQPTIEQQAGSIRVPFKTNGPMKAVGRKLSTWDERKARGEPVRRGDPGESGHVTRTDTLASRPGRNKRSVWEVTTQPFAEAHFATFPPALVEPCILAGCPKGGTVLDPFGGAGTTALVADRLQRSAILIELNPKYAAIAERRINGDAPMFATVAMESAP